MSELIATPPEVEENKGVRFNQSDVEELMEHHDLSEEAREIIREENLAPVTILERLHNNFPQYALFKQKVALISSNGKNKYSGLPGFREVCAVLEASRRG